MKILSKLKQYSQTRPNRSKVVFGIAGLLAIAIFSVVVVTLTYQEPKTALLPQTKPVVLNQITITAEGFNPATITIKPGTKVVWTNKDSSLHQIQANPHPTGKSLPSLKSAILNSQQTYEYTFNKIGTYEYHDQLKPTINGKINVEE